MVYLESQGLRKHFNFLHERETKSWQNGSKWVEANRGNFSAKRPQKHTTKTYPTDQCAAEYDYKKKGQ
ncbi:MAG: hypothetical protein [Microvirus sp.]|nr:MAG: hypothetical protein [Microvirus sp.]